MKDERLPVRIEPQQVTRIWGRRRLDPVFPCAEELPEPVGEVWLTGKGCRLADGQFAGRTLEQAWKEMPEEWKGTRLKNEPEFPILAKFIFPELTLSIQVHPDDAYAARHEIAAGGRGKTEMWYVLVAKSEAEVVVGLKHGEDESAVRRAMADGTLESVLQHVPVAAGDTIYMPPGTVHTIGPGQVLCEIQEYSDITYRIFDYNRTDANGNSRELHVTKALDVLQYGQSAAGKTRPVARKHGPVEVTYLAACRYFATERWRFAEPVNAVPSKGHFDLLVFIGGAGEVVVGANRLPFRQGEAWFVPAGLAGYRLEPAGETTLLRAYVPDLTALGRSLDEDGMTPSEKAGFLFT